MNGSKRTKQVRLLTDRDAEAYWHLRMNSINESPELACPGVVRELALHARGWRNVPSIHAMEGGCIWGGHDDGELVGVVAVSRYLMRDRKSVVKGKSVSVRGDLGGRRSIKKKQK